MNYLGKTVIVNGLTGKVVAEDITHIKIITPSGTEHLIDKINNVITIVTLAIKLIDLLSNLWKKIKSRF